MASTLRQLSGQVDPPFCASLVIATVFPEAVVTGRDLPDGIEEVVTATSDGLLVIYRRDLSTAARRFAIAHAVAHMMFDLWTDSMVVDDAREARADEFATELLVPTWHLALALQEVPTVLIGDTYLDRVDVIAAYFHVPPAVIDQRIRGLDRTAIL